MHYSTDGNWCYSHGGIGLQVFFNEDGFGRWEKHGTYIFTDDYPGAQCVPGPGLLSTTDPEQAEAILFDQLELHRSRYREAFDNGRTNAPPAVS